MAVSAAGEADADHREKASQNFCKSTPALAIYAGILQDYGMDAEFKLDTVDLRILRVLQANGRATYDEVAAEVSLFSSATLRRVKRLEDAGVIAGYVALVKPEAVGLSLTAYITVRLEKHSETHKRKPMDAFRASVQTWPDVVECSSLTGEMDYLLRVLVSDMAHYSRFVMDTLLKHPSVQDCKTSFVLDRVKQTTALPLQESKSR